MAITGGVSTVVRFGLKQHRVRKSSAANSTVSQSLACLCYIHIGFAEEACCGLPDMSQEGHQKLSSLQR